jgi:ADP-heptose:LPS heptosyltransferase
MLIKNILAVRTDRFGEFLLNIPAFKALKDTYQTAKLTLAVNPAVEELARMIDCIDETIPWEDDVRGIFELMFASYKIRKAKFDLCVIFNPSREFNIVSYLAGIPVRVGYDRKCGFLLTHKTKDEKHLALKHEVEYNLGLARLAGAGFKDYPLTLSTNNDIIKDLLESVGIRPHEKLIAVHPWTSDPLKQWPIENFRELVSKIFGRISMRIIIVGKNEGQGLRAGIDFTNKTSLPQLAALLKRSSLLISGDSGPVHLAASVGTPVIALFRNDIPGKSAKRWGPWGSGHTVIEKSSLKDITTDEVLDAIKEKLK